VANLGPIVGVIMVIGLACQLVVSKPGAAVRLAPSG
jgi:hypothetical protein